MDLRTIVIPLFLLGAACSSETTVQGTGGGSGDGGGGSSGSGASAGAGGSGSGGSAGADASTGGSGGTGTGGSGGSTPTGGTGGGGTGGTGGGSGCDAGPVPCGVEIVAQGLTKPFGLVVHSASVYFSTFDNPGQVSTCPKAGCAGAPTPVASNQNMPKRLALSGDRLFWTNNSGSVMTCVLPCASAASLALLQNAPDHVAASATHVFYTDAANFIRRCEHSGMNCTPMIQAEGAVGGLAYSSVTGSLYWSVPSKGYIKSCKAMDCASGQTNLFQGNPNVAAIATNPAADTIFSAHELNPSPLKKCAAAGCLMTPTDLTSKVFYLSPVSLAADSLDVFVLESTNRVSRCASGGCPLPTVLSDAAGTPGTIAVDGSHAYWTATLGGVGYVLRRPKS